MHKGQLSSVFSTACIVLTLACTWAHAGQVDLAWDPPAVATNVAGYKIHYGRASGRYEKSINVGNQTSYTLTGLTDGTTYYFAATAWDNAGRESDYSNEVRYTVPNTTTTRSLLTARFESGTDGFAYVDDAFRGTRQPAYASGGYNNGALQVTLGGINDDDIHNLSGGWRRAFTVSGTTPASVAVTFRYNLTLSKTYERVEYSDVLVTVNNQYLGTEGRVARLIGHTQTSTGWQTFTTTLQLAPGTYQLTLGGFNNRKTLHDEVTTILLDDVVVTMRAPAVQPALPAVARLTDPESVPSPAAELAHHSPVLTETLRRIRHRLDTATAHGRAAYGSPEARQALPLQRLAEGAPRVDIWLEAEEGVLTTRMASGVDVEASSGRYLWTPAGQDTLDTGRQEGEQARYTFTVPQDDTYVMWGRVHPETTGHAFFLVTIAEATATTPPETTSHALVWAVPSQQETAHGTLARTWVWDQMAGDTLPIVFLRAGEYTLTMQAQGDSTQIDRILITNDLEYRP